MSARFIIDCISQGYVKGHLKTYVFTTKGTDSDLDGIPARIHRVDQSGCYEMHFIDGSRIMVFPSDIRILD